MKSFRNKFFAAMLAGCVIISGVALAALDPSDNVWSGLCAFAHQLNTMAGWKVGTTGTNVNSAGLLTAANATVTGNLTSKCRIATVSDVSLTSPTRTFSAAGKSLVRLTADANLTTITLTGGALWQEVEIISGAGSNTLHFDDNGTSSALGSDVTLTESQSDTLRLRCTSADGDEWAKVGGNDN
jgi:hypothetical protein